MGKIELYEKTYKRKKHFSFGENWKEFIELLDDKRISEAKKSLVSFLGGTKNIKNKTFVDVGCGSGLFSLAAYLLGAKQIISVDIDDSSIWCANRLKEKYAKNSSKWIVKKGSALDKRFISVLGNFDIVYSWGVLHHTGNMYKAFDNILLLGHKKSVIYLAIYNDSKIFFEGTSSFWLKMKRFYNNSSKVIKNFIYTFYKSYLIFGITMSGRNPFSYIKNYRTMRGMNFFTDIKDWLGGYPYEYASADKIITYFTDRGCVIKKTYKARSLGCNEFLFEKII